MFHRITAGKNRISVISGLLLFIGNAAAQQYVISTVVGGAPPIPAQGLTAAIGAAAGVATDVKNNLYFVSLNCVFRLDPNGVLTRVAGTSVPGYSGDGGRATSAQLDLRFIAAVTVDTSGNVFIADSGNNRIRRVAANGVITTVAGNGTEGYSGDGGPATQAQLSAPRSIAVDSSGNLLIADRFRVRKISTNGIITTVAGKDSGSPGDGGPATEALLGEQLSLASDQTGNFYIADLRNNRIRKVSAAGTITTVAGNGNPGFSGDGGPAMNASIYFPYSIAVDKSGDLFIAEYQNARIRKVSVDGAITTIAGNGGFGVAGDGGPATKATLLRPLGVAVNTDGDVFITGDLNGFPSPIRKISADGIINTVMGSLYYRGDFGDGGPANNVHIYGAYFIAADRQGGFFIAETFYNIVRKVSSDGVITTVVGNGIGGFSGDGGPAIDAQVNYPTRLAVDASGNLYIADAANYRVRKVSPDGIITTIAGNGSAGYSGDGGPATSAQLAPHAVAVDASGNVFVSDFLNHIRKISSGGTIATIAGNGNGGSSGDGGPAVKAGISPYDIAADSSGNVFFTDGSYSVRKVSTTGTITTVAGVNFGFSGDGGQATSATLTQPHGVAVDDFGNLFIADWGNNRIRRVSANGIMTTIAGNGTFGLSGDGGIATRAALKAPEVLAVGTAGTIFVAGDNNNTQDTIPIRILTPTNQPVMIDSVLDAASESAVPVSPGKIVAIYGRGLGPSQGETAAPANGRFGTELAGTTVLFDGIAAPLIYASDSQVITVVPYSIFGITTNVQVVSREGIAPAFSVAVAASSPGIFTANSTGAGQAASINSLEGSFNTASTPVKIGSYISLYLTGEGQTTPAGIDGNLGTATPAIPDLPVTATVDGLPAVVQYKGGVYGAVAGLMQLNIQIPAGVKPGGYVPVVVQVGSAATTSGAVWIAVSAN